MENHILMFPDVVIKAAENAIIIGSNLLDRRELIIKSLYWDKIVITTNNIAPIRIVKTHEVEVLVSEGLLVQEMLTINDSGGMGQLVYNANIDFLVRSLARKDINFIAGDVNKVLVGRQELISPQQGELLTLLNAIPEPDSSVNINDVLEFRLKRKDELNLLMKRINEMNHRVLSAENKEEELNLVISEIDQSCADIIRLYGESRVKFNLSEVKFNFSIPDILGKTGMAYAGATKLGLPQTTAIIAATVSGISSIVNLSGSISLRKIDKTNPFNYVGQMSVKLN